MAVILRGGVLVLFEGAGSQLVLSLAAKRLKRKEPCYVLEHRKDNLFDGYVFEGRQRRSLTEAEILKVRKVIPSASLNARGAVVLSDADLVYLKLRDDGDDTVAG